MCIVSAFFVLLLRRQTHVLMANINLCYLCKMYKDAQEDGESRSTASAFVEMSCNQKQKKKKLIKRYVTY